MKNSGWIFLFAVSLIVNLVAIVTGQSLLEYISKPLIIPALAGFFVSAIPNDRHRLKHWILAALLLSWMGDILLMFQDRDEEFFLLGLGAFLISHIFYILFFHRIRSRENIKSRFFFVLIVAGYYAGLIIWLSPYLGEMKVPVRIYGIVISFMLMLALHTIYSRNRKAGLWMTLGAILFVISDSILAINKFYQPVEGAAILIMISYGLAQFFIVKGAAQYITSINKN